MTDDLDFKIRRALRNVAEAAPRPIDFDEMSAAVPSRRSRSTMIGLAAGIVAAVAVAAAIVAGYEPDGSTVASTGANADYTVPIAEGAALPAGTPLRNGFVVPQGTRLIGRLFEEAVPLRPGVWQAVLALDGHPATVYDALASQARTIGYHEVAWSGDACRVNIATDRSLNLADLQPGQSVRTISCHGRQYLGTLPELGYQGSEITISVVQGRAFNGTTGKLPTDTKSHVVITGEGVAPPEKVVVSTEAPPANTVEVTPPDAPLTIAGPGEVFITAREMQLTVLPGTELVAPPAQGSTEYGGFVAILRITGDPAKVLQDYTNSFISGATWDGQPPAVEAEVDDYHVMYRELSQAGGDYIDLQTFTPKDGTSSWLKIEYGFGP